MSGPVQITAALDAAATGWRIEAVDAMSKVTAIASGTGAGSIARTWDAGAMPDGTYTVRVIAWDKLGNERVVEARTRVVNAAPALATAPFETEPAITGVPITYSAVSAALIELTIGDGAARGTPKVQAGTAITAEVPVDLSALAAGTYPARVKVTDAQGRSGSADFTVRILPALPKPQLQELPAVSGQTVSLQWSLPASITVSEVAIGRTGPDGTVTLPVASAAARSLTDRPPLEGDYTYTVMASTADGRRATSMGRRTSVGLYPPELGSISVAPIDGKGLNMRWQQASSTVGLDRYDVYLIEGGERSLRATVRPTAVGLSLPLPAGSYQVILSAVDRAGNRSDSEPMAFRVQPGAVALMMKRSFLPTDVPGVIEEGRTWVPLRLFSQALGYEVHWNQEKQLATLLDSTRTRLIYVTVGEPVLRSFNKTEEQSITLPGAPRTVEGRIIVPLRALLEALGAQVQWHEETQTVEIVTN